MQVPRGSGPWDASIQQGLMNIDVSFNSSFNSAYSINAKKQMQTKPTTNHIYNQHSIIETHSTERKNTTNASLQGRNLPCLMNGIYPYLTTIMILYHLLCINKLWNDVQWSESTYLSISLVRLFVNNRGVGRRLTCMSYYSSNWLRWTLDAIGTRT